MKVQGVNRVYIVVRDLDKGVAFYSKLLGATFNDAKVEGKFGVRAALSWDAGIEMLSPLPGSNSPWAMAMEQFLEKSGGGLFGVAFSVSSADEARTRAEGMGLGVTLLEFNPDEIKQHFQDRFKIFKEYILNPEDAFGVSLTMVQIEPK
jgi:catechol 2,3-dioxygenase-like lactoylglutathione lyase family enzyme